MRKQRKHTKLAIFLVLVALLMAAVAPVAAQDDGPVDCGHPVATYLANLMDMTCETLQGYVADGFGYGEIVKAWHLSQFAADFDVESPITPEDLLALKQGDEAYDGLGWGRIRQLMALVGFEDADGNPVTTYEEALQMFQSGMGWGEIRDALELEKGAPPWAGPPPWAGGPHRDDDADDGDDGENGEESNVGPPDFVNPPGLGNNGNHGNHGNNGNNGNHGNNGNNGNNGPGGGPPDHAGPPGGGGPPGKGNNG